MTLRILLRMALPLFVEIGVGGLLPQAQFEIGFVVIGIDQDRGDEYAVWTEDGRELVDSNLLLRAYPAMSMR